nr:putative ribonuclease H-like domain-containing protein [Tanacetum cinerariifolium]
MKTDNMLSSYYFNAAYVQLVLRVNKVTTVFNKVNAAKSRVTTAGWIKWLEEQDMRAKELKIYLLGFTRGIRANVIKNGNKVLAKTVGIVKQPYKPTTVEEKLDRKNEMKARGTLLMALSNKDQLKFHSYQDAKFLMEAIEKRLQKLISKLEIQSEVIEQKNINLKLLRSLPSEWKTHALIWRNKAEIKIISLDDLYNNLKIYEPGLTRSSSTSQNPQNVAFVSSNSISSTNEADNIAYGVSTAHTQDLHWEMAMLTIRARRFIKRTECRTLKNQENRSREYGRKIVPLKNSTENALIAQDGIGGYDWSYQVEEEHPTNFSLMALTYLKSSSNSDSEDNVKSRSDKGYHAVPPPYTGNYIPPKPDLMFIDEQVKSKSVDDVSNVSSSVVKTVESKVETVDVKNKVVYNTVETKPIRKNNFSPPIIKDWISEDESEVEFEPKVEDKNVRPSIEKIIFLRLLGKQKIRPISNAFKRGYSHAIRPFNKYSTYKKTIFNKEVNVVKASACWVWKAKHSSASNTYKKYSYIGARDGKGRISGKAKIKTGTLDFDDVYFGKELKYNLFSVSQMCDKKNNVLFTDTECLVLSSTFKLLDESQVLLRVPRKDNIYSVDLKSVVPTRGLTCLFAKATTNESSLWHMRLGHINYKTTNKLMRGNLVRGLPSNIFENNHGCVACQKGKQHKASYKAKVVNSIRKSLHMLHMDLFGPINVKSLMKKYYCLVITDDFSRFSWLCDMKGIKREFSVLRTLQQNGVAERKNRTLIEAVRTMLVDSKLPTTFWVEAVNVACYDYVVYQMDVKSAFLYGNIEEEVYVCQPLGFEDPDFPNKVYKVEKILYELHQAPACQDKYVADILKKFDFSTVKTTSTLIEPNKALVKDAEAKDVDVHLYRSMIGSLMYLADSMPDIIFAICAYSPFDLEAYSDSDYARASLDRKSTIGDNTVRVNQIVTIFLIESSIHIQDQNRYPVDTSLIHLESRKSPTAELFDVDSERISIRHYEY